jgi:hypothetical protein
MYCDNAVSSNNASISHATIHFYHGCPYVAARPNGTPATCSQVTDNISISMVFRVYNYKVNDNAVYNTV